MQPRITAAISAMETVLPNLPLDIEVLKKMKAVSFAFVSTTAAASPILFESSRLVWNLDILIFFFAFVGVAILHTEEFIQYCVFIFTTAAILFFLALWSLYSGRTSLKEIIQWTPFALAILLLITVHSLPKLKGVLSTTSDSEIEMIEGRSYSSDVEAGSIQPFHETQHQDRPVTDAFEHDFSNMERSVSRQSGIESVRESDIDLEQGADIAWRVMQRMMSPSRVGYFDSILHRPDMGLESPRLPVGTGHSSRHSTLRRNSSPPFPSSWGSLPTNHSLSESERRLLG
ncbi:hypothetical protein B7494_g6695 [Chlorociboria aeruginascens]|nr:hypothetical protein B7494_g6695 [Chlorociboria aeruginascens]